MNIAIVGNYPLTPDCIRGGVESSVYGLAKALCQQHEVDVFDIPRIDGLDTGGRFGNLTIHRYHNPGPHNQDAMKRVDEVIRDVIAIHPDVVHVHGTGEYSAFVYRSIREYGIKTILTVHGLLHVEKKNLLIKDPSLKHIYQYFHQSRIEYDILDYAEHIIVDTEYVSDQIKSYKKWGHIKDLPWMYVIPQGINESYLHIEPKPERNLILSVGSISRRKGHLNLLRAFDQVCQMNSSAQLIIAGTLSEKDYFAKLQDYISASPNKDNIQLLPNLPQEKLMKLYQKASIYALHSQEESQGIALIEAMAAHLPVVSTTVGGVPYVVSHGKTGLLSAYGEIDSFAKNILTLLSDDSLRVKMVDAAHEEAMKYTWQDIAEAVITIYNRL